MKSLLACPCRACCLGESIGQTHKSKASEIAKGSPNVYIGGGRTQYLKIDPEIPDWLRTAVQVAFVVAGLAGSLAGAARAAAKAGTQFGVRCATNFAAGYGLGVLASEAVSRYVIGPALSGRAANEKIAPLLDNLLREYHGVRYEYDEWGQLIRRNSMALCWDAEGHLLWTDDSVVRARYRYDALGRRIEKRVRAVASDGFSEKRVRFIWDNLRLAQEREDAGSVRTYLYDPVRAYAPLARLDRAYAADQAKVYHYHTDPAGTAREVTDAQGRVVWSGGYAAWGKVRANLASSAQPFSPSLRMPGQYHDDESGLHYNTFRYYDAHAGRFISSDPIGLAGGFNLYQYADNPIAWIDPLGLNALPETAAEFAKRISAMSPSERVAAVKGKIAKVAGKNGWTKDSKLTQMNQRDVYKSADGKLYAADTQHGTIEHTDAKGKHLGEFDIDGHQTKPADKSGGHNLKC